MTLTVSVSVFHEAIGPDSRTHEHARARGRRAAALVAALPRMTPTKLAQAQPMRENGMHLTDVAEIIGVRRTTLYRHVK
jgi:transcriptional regulator of acetoin/glycerol metabolism